MKSSATLLLGLGLFAGAPATQESAADSRDDVVLGRVGADFAKILPDRPGLQITAVRDGSPAARCGLVAGDVWIRCGEAILARPQDLGARLADVAAGEAIEIAWYHRTAEGWGERVGELVPQPSPQATVRAVLGVEFAVLESKIRRRLISTDTPYGFKVSNVVEGSISDQLGLLRGNLVMQWDGKPIEEVADLAEWLLAAEPGARVAMQVARRRQNIGILARDRWESVELTVTMPER